MDESFIQERIAQLRIKKGVSARDMSLSIGQSESYINTIENKKSLPSMTVFLYICEYFGITAAEFFDGEIDNPAKFNEVVNDLKRLNENSLFHIAGLTKELANR